MTAPRWSRELLLLGAAGVLVLVVVGVVLAVGVARPPVLEPVVAGDPPEPPAALAWSGWDGRRTCLHVAEPDGTTRQVTCDLDDHGLVAWTAEGIVMETWTPSGSALVVLDPRSGEVVDRRVVAREDPAGAGRVAAEALWSERRDGTLTVRSADGQTVLWEVEAPEGYRVRTGIASPDGGVVAATDAAGRLLVLTSDGSAPPRVWAEDVPEWASMAWEGTDLPVPGDGTGDAADGRPTG